MGLLDTLTGVLSTGIAGDKPAAWAAGQVQQQDNEATREFNATEAQKTRDFQQQQRATAYQTTVADLKTAGLNPMLAYQQGATSTPTGATASVGALPTRASAQQAAMAASAQQADIINTMAQTEKTKADTEVSRALAAKTAAETNLVTNSATNIQQNTQNLKAQIDQIQTNIKLAHEQTLTEVQRQGLIAAQAGLTSVQQQLTKGQISLTEANTKATTIMAKLNSLQIPEAQNKANTQGSWWMQNVSPYLNSAGKVTDILGTGAYMLK